MIAGQKIRALDREWTLPSEPTVDVVLSFRDWIAEREGDPFAEAERLVKLLPPDEAKKLVFEARAVADQLRCFSLKCPLATKYLNTEIGAIHFSWLMLRQNHPDITLDEACAVDMSFARKHAEEEARKPKRTKPDAAPEGNGLTATEGISLLAGNLGG